MSTLLKKLYSQEEKQSYVQRWQESGQTKIVFAREQGLNYDTFLSWIKRSQGSSLALPSVMNSPAPSFVAIHVDGQNPVSPAGLPLMEITLTGGKQIRFYQTVPVEYLRDLLK